MLKKLDKNYKKLEFYLINKIFSNLNYNKSNYKIQKVKHTNTPIKIYSNTNKADDLKYIFDMLNSQLIKNNIPVKIEMVHEKLYKCSHFSIRNRNLPAHINFILDRNINVDSHIGLLRMKQLI